MLLALKFGLIASSKCSLHFNTVQKATLLHRCELKLGSDEHIGP